MQPSPWQPPVELSEQEEQIVKKIEPRQVVCVFAPPPA
jgi:hypothetical protein